MSKHAFHFHIVHLEKGTFKPHMKEVILNIFVENTTSQLKLGVSERVSNLDLKAYRKHETSSIACHYV
jgi:hypothetical protein